MALSVPVKALALLLFLAAIGGATYGVMQVVGDGVTAQLVTAQPAHERLNATAGHTVTYAITLQNRDASPRDMRATLSGPDGLTGRSEVRSVAAASNVTVFVPIELPEGLEPGERALTITVEDADGRTMRERKDALTLVILPEAPGLAEGDSAELVYVGRISATGRVFNTNDPALAGANFLKTQTYRFSQGLLPLQTTPQPSVVEGFYEGVLGMQAGESRTITMPPEKAYGPSMQETTEPRDEPIDRQFVFSDDCAPADERAGRCAVISRTVPRQDVVRYLESTRQGNNETIAEGATFTLQQGPNAFVERISEVEETTVRITLVFNEGDRFTFFPFWPNATVVTETSPTRAVLTTTPTTPEGGTFTMRPAWPTMSSVKSVNETHILVRHSPPVGFSYTDTSSGATQESTIKALTEDSIVVATPSNHPLAGHDLTFDVRLVTLTKP